MKKIVQAQKETIGIDAINNNSIVGIVWKGTGQKTFIIETTQGFKPLDIFLSVAKCWGEETKKGMVKNAFLVGGDAFLFDTKEELFKWLGE